MLLKITHRSEYTYDAPVTYALQRLRLVPASGALQAVRSWSLSIEGARADYGVAIIDPETLELDMAETKRLRAA